MTNEYEKLGEPLEKAATALEYLALPIRTRLKNHSDYKDEHLEELAELLNEVTAMETRLRLLASRVR